MPITDSMRVDAFEASLHRITPADCEQLHAMSVGVAWPHRLQDIELLQSLGRGYIMRDAIGRPLGSGMYFPVTQDLSTIGMMTTAPRLQAAGAGRWMLRRLLSEAETRGNLLNATRQGLRLYLREGFAPVQVVCQQQGIARAIHMPDPVPGTEIRPLLRDDLPQIIAFDAPAFGGERGTVLGRLFDVSEAGMVMRRAGRITGYAMVRNFGRGQIIGPIVAETPKMAMAMIAPIIRDRREKFLRVDTPFEDHPFNAFLAAAGIGVYDSLIEMHRGTVRRGGDAPCLFGLAAQALG